MAEFPASAQTMVGNHSGSCLLHLSGAAITVKFMHGVEIASWPYNCIRQFRADEDTKQFSFFSGRRGPYGVAEYKFDMTKAMLLALQDALTQFTGAQFSGNTPISVGSSLSTGSLSSPAMDQHYTLESFRSPKQDPLPEIPGTPPNSADMFRGYTIHGNPNIRPLQNQKHSVTDVFATLPKEQRNRLSSSSPGRPPIPAPYDSRTIDARGKRGSSIHTGSPAINSKYAYQEIAGNFSPQGARGSIISYSPVPSPKLAGGVIYAGNRKMSHGDDVFRSSTMGPARTAKLVRQVTEPSSTRKYGFDEAERPQQGTTRSPVSPPLVDARVTGEDGASDLDFGVIPLRRSSPQVDRKNTRKGRVSPPDRQPTPPHDLYNVPRPTGTGSSSSPPLSEVIYKVPRPHAGESLSQDSVDGPTFTNSPTEQENVYNIPKPAGNGSDLYSTPRPQRQLSSEEADASGAVMYNVPPSRQTAKPPTTQPQMVNPQEDGRELCNSPKPALTNGHEPYDKQRPIPTNGHELYNTPKAALTNGHNTLIPVPANGHETYNVPRASVESYLQQEGEGVYNVPRPVETTTQSDVPKRSETRNRGNYDSLQMVQYSTGVHQSGSNHQTSNEEGPSLRFKPLPTPGQEAFTISRPATSSPSRGRRTDGRYPYDYVDHKLPRTVNGTLKSSRSCESLVHRRVNLSPDSSSPHHMARTHRTPSPRALNHKYIEIDIVNLEANAPSGNRAQQRPENLYAEIPDSEPIRGSHPSSSVNSNHYMTVPSNIRASAINTPAPQGKMYTSGSVSVSKEARALHQEGYELVLPAEEAARNRAVQQKRLQLQQATQPRNIIRGAQSHSIQFAKDGFSVGSVPLLSTSGPLDPNPTTDEYIIVNRRDFHQPTQPRDIPVPLPQAHGNVNSLQSTGNLYLRPAQDEQYVEMTSVQQQQVVTQLDKSTGSSGMVRPVPVKKRGSASISSSGGEQSGRHSLCDSLDLDSIETGSRTSVCSSYHLDELVGPLSPMEVGTPTQLSQPVNVPGKKNMIRIAAGSPHNITPSKVLRRRSHSVENILDERKEEKPQKYENITDEDLAAKHALSASSQLPGGPKKPPMPLPRPGRPEQL